MAVISVDVKGILEVNQAILALTDRLKKRVLITAYKKAVRPLILAARNNIKDSAGPHKRYSNGKVVKIYYPGNLRKSIGSGVIKKKDTPAIWVGPYAGNKRSYDGFYGAFLEKGTRHMAARPFMMPAFNQTKDGIKVTISQEVKKSLAKWRDR